MCKITLPTKEATMAAQPTDYARIAVDIGKKRKKQLLHYAVNKGVSVSDLIRELVSKFLEGEAKR